MFPSSLEDNINHVVGVLLALRLVFLRKIKDLQLCATLRYYSCMGNFYFSPTEVASRLGLGVEAVRRLLRSGKLPGVHISRKCWRISDDDLNDFLKKRKR